MQEVSNTMTTIKNMMTNKKTIGCGQMETEMPNLLLDPGAATPAAHAHLAGCAECQKSLAGLQSTMHLLDAWAAPEPSPYFGTRMQAKLRAEQQAAPAGWLERLRSTILFGSNRHLRTAGAAALAAVLAVGGGSAFYMSQLPGPVSQVQASATVRDLQSLDGNAQLFQQLNALDADDSDAGTTSN